MVLALDDRLTPRQLELLGQLQGVASDTSWQPIAAELTVREAIESLLAAVPPVRATLAMVGLSDPELQARLQRQCAATAMLTVLCQEPP